jgi:hypothetical protein
MGAAPSDRRFEQTKGHPERRMESQSAARWLAPAVGEPGPAQASGTARPTITMPDRVSGLTGHPIAETRRER